jgi:predicted nucleic acid-binding protein
MKVAVKDANILIDLIESELLELWFKLGVETYISDLVRLEIQKETQVKVVQTFVDAGLLKVETLTPSELIEANSKRTQYRISIEDASALILAQKKKAMLLSGDATLRKATEAEKIEVHGVIWVFDHLIDKKLLLPAEAIAKLQALQASCAFLPQTVCDKRIHEWRKRI